MKTIPFALVVRALLTCAVFLFAGCKKVSISSDFKYNPGSYSSDWTVNGQRTITRSHDGITRKLEAPAGVTIQNGKVTTFPKAALIKIQESAGSEERQAELRDNGGSLELWIKDKGIFRRGSPEEETWLEKFLNELTTK